MNLLWLPAAVLLGKTRYSIYILHLPLRVLWDNLDLGFPVWLNLPLYFGVLVAFLSFRCFETPMRKLIATWRPGIPVDQRGRDEGRFDRPRRIV